MVPKKLKIFEVYPVQQPLPIILRKMVNADHIPQILISEITLVDIMPSMLRNRWLVTVINIKSCGRTDNVFVCLFHVSWRLIFGDILRMM